jgi:hypothetical protein
VSLLCVVKGRLSGAREVNLTPLDVSDVGKVDKMPAEATEWRFNMRRDIIVTLILCAVGLDGMMRQGSLNMSVPAGKRC